MGDGERLILRMLPGQRFSINLKETCKVVGFLQASALGLPQEATQLTRTAARRLPGLHGMSGPEESAAPSPPAAQTASS